jgi:hypothetical protein
MMRNAGAGVAAALLLFGLCSESSGQTKSAKRGVAFGYHTVADMNAMKPGISWWYNWSPSPDSGVVGTFPNSEVAFMPMVWGGNFTVSDIVSKIPNGSQYLLTFNEPNFVDQAHLTPQQMASLWPQIEQIAAQKNLKIVGPAVNYCGNCTVAGVTNPVAYLDQFFSACPSCKVDYVAIHWYACSRSALVSYIDGFKKYNKPIWVTEIACWEGTPTLDQQKTYMTDAVDVMEHDPMVFRYSWFNGDRAGGPPYISLYAPTSGQLTELGQLYKSLPFVAGSSTPTATAAPTATARPRATATATAAGSLLSLNKPATASSVQNSGTAANLAVDGNTGTRWSSAASDPQWITIDLSSVCSVTRVRLNWEAAYGKAYQIQVSTNNSTWSTAMNVTAGDGGIDDLSFSASGRYVRMYGTARGTGYGYSLWEFEVYGSGCTTAPPTATATARTAATPTSTTAPRATATATAASATLLSQGRAAAASSAENAGTGAALAVDGNTGTRWSSAFSDPQWIRVDLGATHAVSRVVLTWESAYGKAYQIQTSNDAVTWTSIFTTTTGDGGTDDLAITGSGRYVQMYGTARATGYGYSLWEFQVYGN